MGAESLNYSPVDRNYWTPSSTPPETTASPGHDYSKDVSTDPGPVCTPDGVDPPSDSPAPGSGAGTGQDDVVGSGAGGFAVGVELDFNLITPLLSGGGGTVGLNLEYTSDNGLVLYGVTPTDTPSEGWMIGPSGSVNVAVGTGPWSGPFDNIGVATGEGSLAVFASPGALDSGSGYVGIAVGGEGDLGIAYTQTNYTPILGSEAPPPPPAYVNPPDDAGPPPESSSPDAGASKGADAGAGDDAMTTSPDGPDTSGTAEPNFTPADGSSEAGVCVDDSQESDMCTATDDY